MLTFSKKKTYAAQASVVWDIIKGYNEIPTWHPAITGSTMTGNGGVGAVRTLDIQGGIQVVELLEKHDDSAMSFTYSHTEDPPMPFKNYAAEMTVRDEGNNRSSLEWSCRCEPLASEDEIRELLDGFYGAGLDNIESMVK